MKLIKYYRYYSKEKNFKRERNKYQMSSKLEKLRTNFEDKTKFIIKISKSELINSASEDENNGTEELQMMNTCVTLQSYNGTWTNPVKKSPWKKTASSIICSHLANILSSSSKKKNSTLKMFLHFLTFQEIKLSGPNIKRFLIFPYIFG